MPRFNGTGPRGQGSGTGRGLGPCGGDQRRDLGLERFNSNANSLSDLEKEEKELEKELAAVREKKASFKSQ